MRLTLKLLLAAPVADGPQGKWDACYQLKAQLEPKTKLPEPEGILRPAAFNPA